MPVLRPDAEADAPVSGGELRGKVEAFLAEHHVMTLATRGEDGLWAAAVFYVHDGLRLYFLSSPKSRHARNLAASPSIAATIQRDYDDWPGIRGIQLSGSARELAGGEETRARELYGRKFAIVGKLAQAPAAIVEAFAKVRWYEVVPDDLYLIDNTIGFAHRERLDLG